MEDTKTRVIDLFVACACAGSITLLKPFNCSRKRAKKKREMKSNKIELIV